MKQSRIFYGTIYQITEFKIIKTNQEDKLMKIYKEIIPLEDTWLVQLKSNEYVRLSDFNYYLYFRYLFPKFAQKYILTAITPYEYIRGIKFIKEHELKPFYKKDNILSLKKKLANNKS